MDPLGIFDSFGKIQESWIERSDEFRESWITLIHHLQDAAVEELSCAPLTSEVAGDATAAREAILGVVRRQANFARRCHNILSAWIRELVERARGLNEKDRLKALFWARQIISSLNPSNFFWTNPVAVQKFLDTYGESLVIGLEHWWKDTYEGDGLARMVDTEAFAVGRDLAITPGAVINKNELAEVIQYEATTDRVYETPVVIIPPWINKFYVFDLRPEASMVRYLVNQGFTVFIISWRNPTAAMRQVTLDDYLIKGALMAVETAREICRARRVHTVGYCIGGTLLAALMAWLARKPHRSNVAIADWSLLSTLVDFSEPGELGVFITAGAVEVIEALMKIDGYLDKKYISLAFRLLGADSLIWRNVINNYLYGGKPPKSDMLFWNADGTNLPEAMCSFYLREFYLHNRLIEKDGVTLAGRPIDLGLVNQPLYAVGTQLDHICPWRSTFRTTLVVSGPVRYVLSSEGHITGIINPPSEYSRRRYWAGEVEKGDGPHTWMARQEERIGSWWEDWIAWLVRHGPQTRKPPPLGS
ncbi:MAG: hypothetical protein N2Z74_08025, partial [Syntrophales bacterium]|nr:hypothetical protein [Syntrophales bacterium]